MYIEIGMIYKYLLLRKTMNKEIIQTEIQYKAVRSSGAGGQNVNKVATKVQIQFFVEQSNGLTADEKTTLTEKLANRITKEGFIMVECGETRSQLKNKELCTQRLFLLLENALKKDKKRIATKIPKSVIKKRLEDKQRNAEKKQNRKFRF
ncbi:MAG: alternative ribosome rescue aminoacyl-tRNA hydrolase ArfB [Myroides sp.]|nr:alternative ribosome rescue aminoacyl-tRNA hydrolase ArfB [Myroides sp.]